MIYRVDTRGLGCSKTKQKGRREVLLQMTRQPTGPDEGAGDGDPRAVEFSLTDSPETACRMAVDLALFCVSHGLLGEGRRWLDRALAGTPGDPPRPGGSFHRAGSNPQRRPRCQQSGTPLDGDRFA